MRETEILAKNLFRSNAELHLTKSEIEEFGRVGLISSGTPGHQWNRIVGKEVSEHDFYEYQVYKPSQARPYVEKIYAVILVSRDRNNENCYVQWKPPIELSQGSQLS